MMHAEFLGRKQQIFDIIIKTIAWRSTFTISAAYILPSLGVSHEWALIMDIGILASAMSFVIYPNAVNLANDIHNNRKIGFLTTLPIPWWLVCMKAVCSCLMAQLIISACASPIVSCLAFSDLSIALISWPTFTSMFLVCNVFCACFTLLVATFIPNAPLGPSIVSMRYIFPLWYLGAFQFTWQGLYNVSPLWAIISLANPYVYMMEGMRGAMFPAQKHLPTSACLAMISLFALGLFLCGSYRLKKQLDAV
jgi:hypothetical protein